MIFYKEIAPATLPAKECTMIKTSFESTDFSILNENPMLQDITLRQLLAISLGAIAGALVCYYLTFWLTPLS